MFDISKDKSRTFCLTWFFMRTQLLSISSEPFVLVSFSDVRHSDVLLRRSWNKKHALFNISTWQPSILIIFEFLLSSSTQMSREYVTTCTDHSSSLFTATVTFNAISYADNKVLFIKMKTQSKTLNLKKKVSEIWNSPWLYEFRLQSFGFWNRILSLVNKTNLVHNFFLAYLHLSISTCFRHYGPIIRRNNCVYGTLGTCYCVWMTIWYAGWNDTHAEIDKYLLTSVWMTDWYAGWFHTE